MGVVGDAAASSKRSGKSTGLFGLFSRALPCTTRPASSVLSRVHRCGRSYSLAAPSAPPSCGVSQRRPLVTASSKPVTIHCDWALPQANPSALKSGCLQICNDCLPLGRYLGFPHNDGCSSEVASHMMVSTKRTSVSPAPVSNASRSAFQMPALSRRPSGVPSQFISPSMTKA